MNRNLKLITCILLWSAAYCTRPVEKPDCMVRGEDISPSGLKYKNGRLYFRMGHKQHWSFHLARQNYKGLPSKTKAGNYLASNLVFDKSSGLLFAVSRTSIQAADAKTKMVRFSTVGLDKLFSSDVTGIGRARLLAGGYVFYTGATAGPWSPAAVVHKDRPGYLLKLPAQFDMFEGGFAGVVHGNLIVIDRSGNLMIEYDLISRREVRRAELGFSTMGSEAVRTVAISPEMVAMVLAGQRAGQVVLVDIKKFSVGQHYTPNYCS